MNNINDNKLIPASTVLIIRNCASGIEVFMVVRHHQIDFASGALVFRLLGHFLVGSNIV